MQGFHEKKTSIREDIRNVISNQIRDVAVQGEITNRWAWGHVIYKHWKSLTLDDELMADRLQVMVIHLVVLMTRLVQFDD